MTSVFLMDNASFVNLNTSFLNSIPYTTISRLKDVNDNIQLQLDNKINKNDTSLSCETASFLTIFSENYNGYNLNISSVLSRHVSSTNACFYTLKNVFSSSFTSINVSNLNVYNKLNASLCKSSIFSNISILNTADISYLNCSNLNVSFIDVYNVSSTNLDVSDILYAEHIHTKVLSSDKSFIHYSCLTNASIRYITNCSKASILNLNCSAINGIDSLKILNIANTTSDVQEQIDGLINNSTTFYSISCLSASINNASISTLKSVSLNTSLANISTLKTKTVHASIINACEINIAEINNIDTSVLKQLIGIKSNIQNQFDHINNTSTSRVEFDCINGSFNELYANTLTTGRTYSQVANHYQSRIKYADINYINGIHCSFITYISETRSNVQEQIDDKQKEIDILNASFDSLNAKMNAYSKFSVHWKSASIQNGIFVNASIQQLSCSDITCSDITCSEINGIPSTTLETIINVRSDIQDQIDIITSGITYSQVSTRNTNVSAVNVDVSDLLRAENAVFTNVSILNEYIVNSSIYYVEHNKSIISDDGSFINLSAANSCLLNVSVDDTIYVKNNGYFGGQVVVGFSDDRLKIRTKPLTNCLKNIITLNTFKYKVNPKPVIEHGLNLKISELEEIGLSAQEVQSVYPELISIAPCDIDTNSSLSTIVSKSGNHYITIKYERLIPVLIQSIKELHHELVFLKNDSNIKTQQIKELQNMVSKLKFNINTKYSKKY